MPELTTDFQSLPEEYQHVIQVAQDAHKITVAPLQLLVGGWSGAVVYLVSVSYKDIKRVEHCILKLDHKGKKASSDEITRHNAVMSKSTPEFAHDHIAELVFDRVEHEGAIAIFYRIAGQSLLKYLPLSKYERQSQLKTIFTKTNSVLLTEWNIDGTFEQAVHPQKVLDKWLGFRLNQGGNIEQFLQKTCQVDPDISGLLISGNVFPNPLAYARKQENWGKVRFMDVATGFIHGDLNTNNILVKFSGDRESLEDYYLIDFALFKEDMPLFYDQRYLEMSYLLLAMSQVSFAKCVNFLTLTAEADVLDSNKVPIELSGVNAVISSARSAFAEWVEATHPSLHDDLWGQYWLAGVAVGLTYCHKAGLSDEQRLTGLIYASVNLKRYATTFKLSLPTGVELLYDENQFGSRRPIKVQGKLVNIQKLPSGTVTFLFTDIEGSTRLSQQYPESMPSLLERQSEIFDQAIAIHNGFAFDIVGDSYAVAFHNASDALEAALDIQRMLHKETWSPAPIKVRMGIHIGTAQLEIASEQLRYSGYATLATSQRIMSVGHGGQILLSRAAVDLLNNKLPADVQLKDMGERRLKDILQPVHIYQLLASDLPFDFPPLNTLEVANHNLPMQLTAFLGRKVELASLQSLLSDPSNRLITIVAPGGMGKTRLSLEAARQMIPSFRQGIYFVALDRITAADMIVQSVADVLPISLSSNDDPKSRILDYLYDKKILFVIDNFEHVLEGATFVQDILTGAPQVQILASSRIKLNLMGETVFNIEGLTVGDTSSAKDGAIQLFVQSAKQTLPKFELNDTVLPAVTEICHLVDGMPLAIILAAAWIDTLAVDEIASEIEKNIDMLETEKRDVPSRQRSVRAVIESSWNQVDVSAQNLLRRLSVFRGGFTRAAAQEAAGASLRGLSQLVDKALLRRDPKTGRYSIHELLRQYAEEQLKLSSEEERSAHQSHAEYFADFMKRHWILLRESQLPALLEVEADIDNIRVAWNYWINQQDAEHLLDFIDTLWIFFETNGSFTPAIQLFDQAAQKLTSTEPDVICARAQIRTRQAWFTALIGLPDKGLQLAQQSIATLSHNSQDISIETWEGININAIFLNRYEIVSQTSQQMTARAERSADVWDRGWALIWSAYSFLLQQQIMEALQAGQDALAIFERLENAFGMSVASGLILGMISIAVDDRSRAKEYFLRGMRAAEEIKYLRLLQIIYDNLGTLALVEHNIEQAQEFFIKSLRISQGSGQTREMLASLRDFASVYIAQGNLDGALQLLAVVLNHSASDQNSLNRPERLRDEAEKARARIEAHLDPERYQAAWQTGQRQNLAEVVNQILN
jgi:predicted ATPase/class 3 adenylate cyclase